MADHEEKQVELELPHLTLYKDGSVCRREMEPLLPPSPDLESNRVASKDITLNQEHGLWARIFLPSFASPAQTRKLPLVLYFHGGGFVFGSPAWVSLHRFWEKMAELSGSIWISASYRLGPEHRLPAAFDDGFSALAWLHSQALLRAEGKDEVMDPWLAHADFGKCFVGGVSSGGVLAHYVVMRAFNKPLSLASWEPLCIRGLILLHPGFVRSAKTEEELSCYQDEFMNWDLAEKCSTLVIPAGSSVDDYFDPIPAITATGPALVLPKTLVIVGDRDPLQYMGLEYVRALKGAGCHVDVIVQHDATHVFFLVQPDSKKAEDLMQSIVRFIASENSDL